MVFYSSLKEVYGDDFVKKYEERNVKHEELTKVAFDKDPTPLYLRNKGYNQEQCYSVKSYNGGMPNVEYNNNYKNEERYQKLREKGENERMDIINNMNTIERPLSKEDLIKKFNQNDLTKRSILMERLNMLQDEMNKKNNIRNSNNNFNQSNPNLANYNYLNNQSNNQGNIQENFQNFGNIQKGNFGLNQNTMNFNSNQQNINQEFLDLFFLIILGLILLYVFEYIFKMGKIIGARGK